MDPRSRSRSPRRSGSPPRMRSRSPNGRLSRSRSRNGRYRSLSRSRSRSRSRGRSYSRSRSRSRSYSRSRSRSRSYSRSRSRSRSWSRERGRGRNSREPGESPLARSTKIVVERLTKNINEDHLYEIFGQFGHIKDLDLPINRSFGTNRGTAYILFDHQADAEAAIAHMHEAQIDGATVHVSIVLHRRKLSPPPPTARRGANIDPRQPFPGPPRGGGGRGGRGRGPAPMDPGSRFGPRSDVYRPRSRSPDSRGGAGSYRSRSRNSYSSRSRSPVPRGGGASGGRSRSNSFDGYRDRSRSRSADR